MTFCNEEVDQDEPDRETIVGAIRLLEEALVAKKRQLEKYDSVHGRVGEERVAPSGGDLSESERAVEVFKHDAEQTVQDFNSSGMTREAFDIAFTKLLNSGKVLSERLKANSCITRLIEDLRDAQDESER